MRVEVVTDFGTDSKTNLPTKLRMKSLALNETGYLNLSYGVDLYDLEDNILVPDFDSGQIEIHPQPRYDGSEQIPADELTPELEVFINDIKPLIESLLETIEQ